MNAYVQLNFPISTHKFIYISFFSLYSITSSHIHAVLQFNSATTTTYKRFSFILSSWPPQNISQKMPVWTSKTLMWQCHPLRQNTSGLPIFFKVEYDLFDLADGTSKICFCRIFPFLTPSFHCSTFILQNSELLDILYNSIPHAVSTIWEPFSHPLPLLNCLTLWHFKGYVLT